MSLSGSTPRADALLKLAELANKHPDLSIGRLIGEATSTDRLYDWEDEELLRALEGLARWKEEQEKVYAKWKTERERTGKVATT